MAGPSDVSFLYSENKQQRAVCEEWLDTQRGTRRSRFIRCVRTCVCVYAQVCARVRACITGQAPWKQQQRSSAFKWIKTPAQSPEPAGTGQAGCSLDEDLRLIISHAAFVFAATVASTVRSGPYRLGGGAGVRLRPQRCGPAAVADPWALTEYLCRVFVFSLPSCSPSHPRCYGLPRIQWVTLTHLVKHQRQIHRVTGCLCAPVVVNFKTL